MRETDGLLVRIVRRWWVVLLTVAIVTTLATWYVSETPPRYQADQPIAIAPSPELDDASALRANDLLNDPLLAPTVSDIINSPRVVNPAFDAVGLSDDARAEYSVTATTEPRSNILRLRVEGPRASVVQDLSEAVQARSVVVVSEVRPLFTVESLGAGAPAVGRITLSWIRLIGLAAALGLGIGVLAAIWLDLLLGYMNRNRQSVRRTPVVPDSPRTSRPAQQ